MPRKLTQEEAEQRLKEHRPEYTFMPFVYAGLTAPITMICPRHGSFITSIGKITRGYGCYKCGVEAAHAKTRRRHEEFMSLIKTKFEGSSLDFSSVVYKEVVIHNPTQNRLKPCVFSFYFVSLRHD